MGKKCHIVAPSTTSCSIVDPCMDGAPGECNEVITRFDGYAFCWRRLLFVYNNNNSIYFAFPPPPVTPPPSPHYSAPRLGGGRKGGARVKCCLKTERTVNSFHYHAHYTVERFALPLYPEKSVNGINHSDQKLNILFYIEFLIICCCLCVARCYTFTPATRDYCTHCTHMYNNIQQ